MTADEIQGVAQRIEILVKRIVVAETERNEYLRLYQSANGKITQLEETIKTDAAKYKAGIESQYSETRKILGVRAGETTSDAAKRVVAQCDEQRTEIEGWRADLGKWREMIGAMPEESLEAAINRVVTVKDSVRAENDDLRKIVEMVHADLGIKPGDHIGEAIGKIKADARYHENVSLSISASCEKHHTNKFSAEKEIAALQDERDALKREVERLQGIRPELGDRPEMDPETGKDLPARNPPKELPRYGLRWNGPQQPIAVPMGDGYWTPWFVAAGQVEAIQSKHELDNEKMAALDRMYEQAQREIESLRAKLSQEHEDGAKERERLLRAIDPEFEVQAQSESQALRTALYEARSEVAKKAEHIAKLRAKLASRTVEWPEWAREGTRVRVRSTREPVTRCNYVTGEEFRISRVNVNDWEVSDAGRHWAHVGDLEPVAEHVAQPTVEYVDRVGVRQGDMQPDAPPKLGDTVRLMRKPVPSLLPWADHWGREGDVRTVTKIEGTTVFVGQYGWPVSCVEVVK